MLSYYFLVIARFKEIAKSLNLCMNNNLSQLFGKINFMMIYRLIYNLPYMDKSKLNTFLHTKVKVCNCKEIEQSERNSLSKHRGGKTKFTIRSLYLKHTVSRMKRYT